MSFPIVIFINNKELNLEFYRLDDFYYGEIKNFTLFICAVHDVHGSECAKTAVGYLQT
jgi:hypothetical protein